jgi:hypothetical protein
MKSSSKWLVGFGGAIGALVVLAVVLVLTMPGDAELLPENTPEGVVQRYFRAIEDNDYDKAYSYMAESTTNTTDNTILKWSTMYQYRGQSNAWKVIMGETELHGNTATIPVTVEVFNPGSPFDNPSYTQHFIFTLESENDTWKIVSPDYPLYLN